MNDIALFPPIAPERQESPVRAPAIGTSSFSTTRLARMRTTLRRHVEVGRLPGFVSLLEHRGRVHAETFGTMAFASDVPMRRDAIFRLASMTKVITAVGAMTLVEDCRLRLDDPVDLWLPELADRRVLRTIDGPLDDTVPAIRPITLRDLLTFRCGLGEVMFISPTCPLQRALFEAGMPLSTWPVDLAPDEFMKRLGALPLACQPGERWLYHMGSEILGILIARVTGQPLGTFLDERIFQPLGMRDTGFHVPEAKLDRLPTCYGLDLTDGRLIVVDDARGGHASRPPVFESGGGGLVSTADDLLVFGRMMLHKGAHGRERILSRRTVELMTTDHVTPEQKSRSPFFPDFWSERGWGFGVSIVVSPCGDLASVPGRFGWDGAFGTSWYVDPREELIGIFMTQRRPDVLAFPESIRDFWTSAYQLIDD